MMATTLPSLFSKGEGFFTYGECWREAAAWIFLGAKFDDNSPRV
jgi:hypothetical protein